MLLEKYWIARLFALFKTGLNTEIDYKNGGINSRRFKYPELIDKYESKEPESDDLLPSNPTPSALKKSKQKS